MKRSVHDMAIEKSFVFPYNESCIYFKFEIPPPPPPQKKQADFGIITGLFILKLTYKACSLLRNLLICTCIHSYQCYMLKIMKFMTILKLYTYINPYNKKCKYSQEICKHYLSTCKRWQNTHMVLLSFTKCCRWVWGNEYG